MTVVPLLVFCSLMLVAGAITLFAYSAKQHDYEHADRLSLLPMERDEVTTVSASSRGES